MITRNGQRLRTTMLTVVLAAGLGTLLLAPAEAGAAKYIETPHGWVRPLTLDIQGGFVWEGLGLASGARFGIPIVKEGFIPRLNNAVYINFGADFYYIHTGRIGGRRPGYRPGLGIPVAMQWEFYFSDRWTAFGEIGVNVFLDPRLFEGRDLDPDVRHWLLFAVGGRLRFNEHVGLVARIGLPYITFGVTFMF